MSGAYVAREIIHEGCDMSVEKLVIDPGTRIEGHLRVETVIELCERIES